MDGQSGKEGNGGGRGTSTSTSRLGSKVGLGWAWACVREERRRDRDRMVRLALSPLLPRFPLLRVSCHAVPSSCRLPPAVPRCANEPLGGQRGDYDGTTLADLAVRTETVGFDWLAAPLSCMPETEGTRQAGPECRASEVTVRSLATCSLLFLLPSLALSFLIEWVTTVWQAGHPCHDIPTRATLSAAERRPETAAANGTGGHGFSSRGNRWSLASTGNAARPELARFG